MTERRGVSSLYGRHAGELIFVVGTGASMRVFPRELLEGRTVVGCNMAWKVAPVTYGVTIHPSLNIPELLPGEEPRPEILWVTKQRKARKLLGEEQFARMSDRFYYFEAEGRPNAAAPNEPNDAGRILDWVREPHGDHLYQWSSISQTACNLAANLGASAIVLVGCDNAPLLSNHHAHGQHTRWKGADPGHRYRQYYEGLAEVRGALRERGIPVVTLTPFLGLHPAEEDFTRLCRELGRPLRLEGESLAEGHRWKGWPLETLAALRRGWIRAGRLLRRAAGSSPRP